MHVLGHRPQYARWRFTLPVETVERARQACDVAREHRLAQAIKVAGDIEYRFLNLLQRKLALGIEQAELEYLLVRSEQVALDALGDEAQGVVAGLRCWRRRRRRSRLGVRRVLGGISLTATPASVSAFSQAAFSSLQSRPGSVTSSSASGGRAGAVVLDGLAAFAAGFPGRNAQVDELAAAEQRHVAGRVVQVVPVESGNRRQHLALVKALAPQRRGCRRLR